MRRGLLLAPLLAAAALGLAGCGTTGDGHHGSDDASPHRRRPRSSNWLEPFPATAPALVFGVASFAVTPRRLVGGHLGREQVRRRLEDRRSERPGGADFGVLLFPNNDQDEFEHGQHASTCPRLRAATSYKPALPVVLEQGATWRGTMSAPGALAGGLWVRFVLRPVLERRRAPEGLPASAVTWFTDHAYHLEEVAAVPA